MTMSITQSELHSAALRLVLHSRRSLLTASTEALWAASPATERGQPTQISVDSKGQRITYAAGKSIFVRYIDEPDKATQYTQHTAQTTVARFSPSGFYVASGDVSGLVRVWDASPEGTGATKGEYPIIAGRINDIAWDGDSQRIIAVGNGRERFGHCVTADSGNSVGEISGHSSQINTVSIKPQRPMRAATGSDDTSLVFYNGPPFKFATSIREKHHRFVFGTAFSPDGVHLVSVGADKRIQLYDGKTGEPTKQIDSADDEHKGSVFAVSWAPDSKRFATASADQTVKIWSVEGKLLHSWRLGDEGVPNPSHHQVGVAWVPRSEDLIISLDLDGNLNYLSPSSSSPTRVVRGHQRNITALTAVPSTLLTGSSDGRIRAWNLQTGAASLVDGAQPSNYIAALATDPSGQRAITAAWDDTLRLVDSASTSFLSTTATIPAQPLGLAVAPSRAILVATPTSLESFSPDGVHAASTPTPFTPTALAASPTAPTLAVTSADKHLHIYTLASASNPLSAPHTPPTSFPAAPSALAFSPSGAYLAVGLSDGKIHVLATADWSVATTRWSAHTARVTALAWDAGGARAVSGSLDTHVHVWSLARPGERVRAGNAHQGAVNGVVWLGEGEVGSVGMDGCVRVWGVSA